MAARGSHSLARQQRQSNRAKDDRASPRPTAAAALVEIRAGMRLSRHARDEMRLYRIPPEDVEATMSDPAARDLDDRGNTRLTGESGDGRPILVVVARDDPDFVITIFLRT